MVPYTPPTLQGTAFHCPACGAYAQQYWAGLRFPLGVQSKDLKGGYVAICRHCDKPAIWWEGRMVVPDVSSAPEPNSDMAEDVRMDYLEAANIAQKSPRGAAAILRLCVQNLCIQLGLPGRNLNDDIGKLVERGLPTEVQQALDVVRVIGNNAVHPGKIHLKDDSKTVSSLFALINFIADRMITQPNAVEALFENLPEGARNAVAKRDKPTAQS